MGDSVLVVGDEEIFGAADIMQTLKRSGYLRAGREIKDESCRQELKPSFLTKNLSKLCSDFLVSSEKELSSTVEILHNFFFPAELRQKCVGDFQQATKKFFVSPV